MLDRSLQPPLQSIKEISFSQPKALTLDNGVSLYLMQAKAQSLMRLQLVFKAGTATHFCNLVPQLALQMLKEGTVTKDNNALMSAFDYFGAYVETDVRQHYSYFTIFVLEQHLESILELLQDVMVHSNFPEKSFKTLIANRKSAFIMNQQKIKYKASQEFDKQLYKGTPYASNYTVETFDQLTRDEVYAYSKQYHQMSNAFIMVSGGSVDYSPLINTYLGTITGTFKAELPNVHLNFDAEKIYIPVDKSTQTALELGMVLLPPSHPDYTALTIAHILYGGYFGSRLMSNIREDKGFTYGIGSRLSILGEHSIFKITTEVGAHQREEALIEIYKELDRLSQELVPQDELQLVCNYILGNLLKQAEGNFELADTFLAVQLQYQDQDYYSKYIHTLNTITPEHLQTIYQKYLNTSKVLEVAVG